MAVVEYQCNKCNRKVQFNRNIKGIETLKRCTITQNCTGELTQVQVLENHTKPNEVEHVAGIQDQIPRNVLFTYKQNVGKKIWKIAHNLGNIPVVFTYDKNNNELDPTIVHIDHNNLELHFNDKSYSGQAQCIVSNSTPMPSVVISSSSTAQQTVSTKQLTFNQQIVIAALESDFPGTFLLNVDSVDKNGSIQTQSYSVDLTNDDSTWGDYSYIFVKGKKYSVRSFEMNLTNDSYVYFKTSTSEFFEKNKIFILLSSNNRLSYDKILNQLIDVSSVTDSSNPFSFVITQGELYCDTKVVQDVYPYIRPVF